MKMKRLFVPILTLTLALTIFNTETVSAAVQAKWINKGEIEANGVRFIDGKPDDSDRSYYKDGKSKQVGDCDKVPVIKDISSDNTTARLYQQKLDPKNRLSCIPDTSRVEDVTFEAGSVTNATSAGDSDSDSSKSCEKRGSPLAWILCPVIKLLDATMNMVDTQIQALLDVDDTSYKNDQIKQSWASIRNIAYIILIPITLVMVIGTAIGSSLVDAYTVKKAMPRLAIAVIFIALSYEICAFLITLFNTIGYGVIGLMTAPFGDHVATLSLADLFGTNEGLSAILILPQILLMGPAILLILWFFGTTFLLFAGAAFLILTLRQLFIVGLLLLAPLAILAWIFPGNDKLWKSWWGMFSKLLIMFPLIMGIIAMGRIFAVIADSDRGGGVEGSIITPLVKLAAYMLPYAFIPFTFKFAGGIFANIAGVVNDKEKGLFDRQKKKRAENWQGFKAGTKAPPGFRGNNIAARGIRRLGAGVGAGWKGRAGFGEKGLIARDTNMMLAADKVSQSETFKAQMENDPVLRAAAVGSNFRESVRNQQRVFGISRGEAELHARQAQASIGLGAAEQIAAAKQLVMTGTGYDNIQQVTQTLALAAGGNRNTANQLAGFANATTKKVGRAELAPGYSQLAGMVEQEMVSPGYTQPHEYDHAYDEAVRTQGMGAIIGGKFQSVQNSVPSMVRRIRQAETAVNNAHASGNAAAITNAERNYKQVMASTAASIDLAGQLSPEAGTYLADNVLNIPTTVLGQTSTVQSRIEFLRNDMEFGQMHREYTTQQGQQAAAAQAAQAAHQAAQAAAQAAGQAAQQPPNPPIGSDIRLKEDIRLITTTKSGINLYGFRYLGDEQYYVGVIAQEILKTHPEAISKDVFGFYRVDYAQLSLSMSPIETFEINKCAVISLN